jgi:serine protease Do
MQGFYRAGALTAFAVLIASLQPALAAPHAKGYALIKGSLALIGYPTHNSQLPIAFGTGFCVNSDDHRSFFVTNNHVVTDSLGNVAPDLFVVLPKDPNTRHAAKVVRRSAELDIAIVAVDVGNVPPVKLSYAPPEAGDDIAIAGFPYVEVCEMAGLCGDALLASHANKGELGPILSTGRVNTAGVGKYAIIYDALADHGNSGGPLFDIDSGDVYGIVVDALSGYSTNQMPPQAHYNRAISIGVGVKFIDNAPVSVAFVGAGAGGEAPAGSRSIGLRKPGSGQSCAAGSRQNFDTAYGEWLQAHGALQSVAEYLTVPAHRVRTSGLEPEVRKLRVSQTQALARMQPYVGQIQKTRATKTSALAKTLLHSVGVADAADAKLAAGLTSASALNATRIAEPSLRQTARRIDNTPQCS